MEISKPKKALRGLFTRTEPASESESVKQEFRISETANNRIIEEQQSKPEMLTPQPDTSLVTPKETKAEAVSPQLLTPNETSLHTSEKKNNEYSITKIQYNFDRLKLERNNWDKSEYINFIHRIDNAQTEAFFLKGKLISEIKIRFYEGNKNGWKNFCEEHLNMNYTTANQYIRVAEEFDSLTATRTDFGFEHFKALLPVPSEKRKSILETIPSSVSVKALRTLISKTLAEHEEKIVPHSNKGTIKQITENLEKIKIQLDHLKISDLEQAEKWSLLGAFQNLTTEMTKISEILSKPLENKYTAQKHIGATSALHEEDYVS